MDKSLLKVEHPEYLVSKSVNKEDFVVYPLKTLVVSIHPLQVPPLFVNVEVHDELTALFPLTEQFIYFGFWFVDGIQLSDENPVAAQLL